MSCGRPCGLPLPCKRHNCDKICHSGPCPEKCEQPCTAARECGHRCKLPCHDTCPPSTCFATVDLTCACGRIVEHRSCHQFQLVINNHIQQRIRRGEDVNLATDLIQVSAPVVVCRCLSFSVAKAVAQYCQVFARPIILNKMIDSLTFSNSCYAKCRT